MKAIAGVFRSRVDATRANAALARAADIPTDNMILLTPGDIRQEANEAAGARSRVDSCAAAVPGVGVITAIGALGAAVLRAAGAAVEAAESNFENAATEGLPEDEIFVYEEVLRNGHSVLIVIAEENAAERLRELLSSNGAGSIEDARHQWWMGLRALEQELYSEPNRNFADDEEFYRLGFEAALHARTRCKEYDQVYGEMTAKLEEVQRKYPNADLEKPFIRGYERGRDYYQGLCNQSRAA